MNQMLKEKKIVIAGAGGLLGATVVKSVLETGGSVVATDVSLEHLVARLSSVGVNLNDTKLTMRELDITHSDELTRFWQEVDGVSGAVNCTYPRTKSYGAKFFDVTLDSFNENVSVHLGSAFLFAQQCATYFVNKLQPFSLVNISSVYGVIAPKFSVYENTPMTMPVEYAAIKSAIIHLNKYVASYINDSRFRVNSVSPGGILDGQPEAFLYEYRKNTHGAGMLNIEEVTGSIVYLLSEHSKYVTGQNIIVDDGFSL
ncbi:oxidoreductase [Vibrio splendidus]|uniref:oxidoreductase n=1 Tax=Vibrio splendidus TaxID=29497 RepID=UPI0021B346F3|nr:oxidoreductase [Vibrio splendidus]UWZ97350.1 SDR family oxidoreductase [Vibrio splendidus]